MDRYLELNDISFKYDNNSEYTLHNINLKIKRGDIVAVLGESGSGKSTLLRVILGFETPQYGTMLLDNNTIIDESNFIAVEKRGIGMVFQDYALFPHMDISKNIEFGLNGLSKKEKKHEVSEMLKLIKLQEFGNRYPHEISGGQQQRVALARAIAPNPKLILLDEPFSNLDANLQSEIRDDVKKIIKSSNSTSIFVTHDKEDALSIADQVIIMENGKIVDIGIPKDILIK